MDESNHTFDSLFAESETEKQQAELLFSPMSDSCRGSSHKDRRMATNSEPPLQIPILISKPEKPTQKENLLREVEEELKVLQNEEEQTRKMIHSPAKEKYNLDTKDLALTLTDSHQVDASMLFHSEIGISELKQLESTLLSRLTPAPLSLSPIILTQVTLSGCLLPTLFQMSCDLHDTVAKQQSIWFQETISPVPIKEKKRIQGESIRWGDMEERVLSIGEKICKAGAVGGGCAKRGRDVWEKGVQGILSGRVKDDEGERFVEVRVEEVVLIVKGKKGGDGKGKWKDKDGKMLQVWVTDNPQKSLVLLWEAVFSEVPGVESSICFMMFREMSERLFTLLKRQMTSKQLSDIETYSKIYKIPAFSDKRNIIASSSNLRLAEPFYNQAEGSTNSFIEARKDEKLGDLYQLSALNKQEILDLLDNLLCRHPELRMFKLGEVASRVDFYYFESGMRELINGIARVCLIHLKMLTYIEFIMLRLRIDDDHFQTRMLLINTKTSASATLPQVKIIDYPDPGSLIFAEGMNLLSLIYTNSLAKHTVSSLIESCRLSNPFEFLANVKSTSIKITEQIQPNIQLQAHPSKTSPSALSAQSINIREKIKTAANISKVPIKQLSLSPNYPGSLQTKKSSPSKHPTVRAHLPVSHQIKDSILLGKRQPLSSSVDEDETTPADETIAYVLEPKEDSDESAKIEIISLSSSDEDQVQEQEEGESEIRREMLDEVNPLPIPRLNLGNSIYGNIYKKTMIVTELQEEEPEDEDLSEVQGSYEQGGREEDIVEEDSKEYMRVLKSSLDESTLETNRIFSLFDRMLEGRDPISHYSTESSSLSSPPKPLWGKSRSHIVAKKSVTYDHPNTKLDIPLSSLQVLKINDTSAVFEQPIVDPRVQTLEILASDSATVSRRTRKSQKSQQSSLSASYFSHLDQIFQESKTEVESD